MRSDMKKKENRRSENKFASLRPELNLKSRTELLDYDYLHKLTDVEKTWLAKFTEEYVNANIPKDKPRLHKTKKLKKDCYDRNNSRNRDIYTKSKAGGKLMYLEEMRNNLIDTKFEDKIINKIDKSKKLK